MRRTHEISPNSQIPTVQTYAEATAAELWHAAQQRLAAESMADDPYVVKVDGLHVERARLARAHRCGEGVLVALDMYNAEVSIAVEAGEVEITKSTYARGGWDSSRVEAPIEQEFFLREALDALQLHDFYSE